MTMIYHIMERMDFCYKRRPIDRVEVMRYVVYALHSKVMKKKYGDYKNYSEGHGESCLYI